MKKSRILKWFNNQKLGRKILYTCLIVVTLPVLVSEILMLSVISNSLSEKVNTIMVNQLEQAAERTNLMLDIYTNLIYQIYIDSDMIDDVISYRDAAEKDRARFYRDISDKLQQYGVSAEGIECISIILPNEMDITYDFGMASSVNNLWDEYTNIRAIEPYIQAAMTDNIAICSTEAVKQGENEISVFHFSKRMYDLNNIQDGPIATVVMSVNEEVLNEVCNVSENADTQELFAINFIMDKEGKVLSYPDSFYAGVRLNENRTAEEFVKRTNVLTGKNIAINQIEDEELGWIFYNVYDRDFIFREVTWIRYATIILGAALVLITIIIIRYTVVLIEKSVRKIVDGIREVQQGNLDVQVCVDTGDEMHQIAENFNTMTGKVKGLIQEVTEVTEKQKEAEIRALEAQIIALEAQINPHFLYNTLDSINWMAIEKQEYEISKMLRNLGIILRYSINKSNQKVKISEMADWLDKYLSLQKMRFNDAFVWEISIDEGAKNKRIYKLLVQPFVENAILHGFKGIEAGGILRVDIMLSTETDEVTIIIEDNGRGIPKDIVDKLKDVDGLRSKEKHIGLENAFSRMQMYYGERAFWDIRSIPEIGTVVTLKIPVDEKEE